ncbi:3D domain-containing protein [Bdellovibrio svalbardensis]|uniref:3D domain-containing protein n=1 Tax=Bdellovibrio svalbardensis TaxID=2972972 RepID=A0ABT6DJE7_9BACT|nr:3D domain-containing protein [Bdellovibrio svalbardensis]MDG0816960.1 3D domain-containing protein [Bdellovibrio svalbardensis]
MKTIRSALTLIFFALQLVSCAASKASDAGMLNPTIYYKPTIRTDQVRCESSEMTEMKSPQDKVLATMCLKDFNNCVMQGSCFVAVSGERLRSFNYYARGADTIPRFVEVDLKRCPYGYGVRNTCLDPYFTVAADLKIYKVGDVIFVPRLVGAAMPDGETHDGFLIIRDAGGGISGANRFDFFTGFYNHLARENTMAQLGFGDKTNAFEFRLATEDEAVLVRERRGYPGLKKVIIVSPGGPTSEADDVKGSISVN